MSPLLIFGLSIEQSIACLEHLSNEIFYDLFEYLNGYEIAQTFFNLSYRFEQLLNSSSILIKTRFYLFNLEKIMFTNNEISSTKLCSSSNFKTLSFYCSNHLKFLNAHRWGQFILYYYHQLEKFYLTYSHLKGNSNQYSIFFGFNENGYLK
ncbi:unnamed protein product [Rotaria sp. Silwood1]|nr:unnamed protein product [Rotaria sp. Silwood1]